MIKKILIGVVVIFVVLIIIGMAAGGSKSGTNTSSNSGSNNSPAQSDNQPKMAKIGETVNEGDLAFTVSSIDSAASVGNSYSQKTAQGIYYILAVQIKNNGKSTKTINASDFNIVDSQGRKYDYSTDGQTAMEMSDGSTSLFLQQVQPGLGVNGKIIFDVPKDATGLKLMAQGDIFSSPVSIDLGK